MKPVTSGADTGLPRRLGPRGIAFCTAIGAHGCGPAALANHAEAAHVDVQNLSAPVGTTLVQACTPSGPELCFNALDDNCNGVIDEGCGARTGILQFMIAWSAAPANVDLELVTPDRERVPTDRFHSGACHLDRDCPGEEGCGGQNVENIICDGAPPPQWHYSANNVRVDLHGAEPPVRVRFGARLGSRTVGFDVDLSPGDDAKKTFSFDVQ